MLSHSDIRSLVSSQQIVITVAAALSEHLDANGLAGTLEFFLNADITHLRQLNDLGAMETVERFQAVATPGHPFTRAHADRQRSSVFCQIYHLRPPRALSPKKAHSRISKAPIGTILTFYVEQPPPSVNAVSTSAGTYATVAASASAFSTPTRSTKKALPRREDERK